MKISTPLWMAVLAAQTVFSTALAQRVEFNHAFAPEEGLVSSYEQPARAELCLNGSWQFQATKDVSVPADAAPELGPWDATAIKIPSPWNVNAYAMDEGGFMPGGDFRTFPSYPKSWESAQAAWMHRTVKVPAEWDGKRVVLHFGAVGGKMIVYVNGKRMGEGFDIFFPQDYDITDVAKYGGDNDILVKVISSHTFNKPGKYGRRDYLAGSFWGQFASGIWQDVFLEAMPKVSVSDVFVQPWVDQDTLKAEVTVTNASSAPATISLAGTVREWINQAGASAVEMPEVKWTLGDKSLLELSSDVVTVAPGQAQVVTLTAKVNGSLKLWSPEAPNLNGLVVKLLMEGKTADVKYQRFGWRQFSFSGSQLRLNGQPIVLHGDSWHFMGIPQMSRRYAYGWYSLLKAADANAVRLHASVYPPFYQDMADEMGIMILDETPIWASDGGFKVESDLFWTNCDIQVDELVRRDRNHPSVFGWSVCNEVITWFADLWHTPPGMLNHCLDQIAGWRDICLTNDPTRGWISGDGENDAAHGRLPVNVVHYGDNGAMRRAGESGKPWGVGETSMAYYGNPAQISRLNGNRAFESQEGRMEGLAYECYGLLAAQQKYGADYQSVFNIVWYSVQPLPLGKSDLTHEPTLDEGIFFGPYQEGVPGVQPERLGPYCSTVNPGYDPSLPLYRPWAMFDAIRDANTGNTNSPWANPPGNKPMNHSVATAAENSATASYLPDNGARLAQQLAKAGVQLTAYAPEAKTDFLLVDGSTAPGQATADGLKAAVDKVLGAGGTVWVWDIRPDGAAAISQLLGQDISVAPRVTSSFLVKGEDGLIAGLENSGLNFANSDDAQQIAFALDGNFVKSANVVLEACPIDWRRWSHGEQVKTAAVYRSRVEHPGPLAAVAIHPAGNGRIILCNLNPEIRSQKKTGIVQRLFRNEGVTVEQVASGAQFMDKNGRLVHALVCGSFPVANPDDAYTGKLPEGDVQEGGRFDGHRWRTLNASDAGVFDFNAGLSGDTKENAYAYLAVWIKSSKPLNDLLEEPNLPKLTFTYGSDDGCEVYLNGNLLSTHKREGTLDPAAFAESPLLLKLGWNQLVIKVVQVKDTWQFAGKFSCSDASFLPKLEFAAEKPAVQ